MPLLVGVDVGTTNIKAVLYDPTSGLVLATSSHPNIAHHPDPASIEFDPDQLWAAVCRAVRDVIALMPDVPVEAIGVATMGEAGVPLDRTYRPLYPIIAWHDPRTEPYVRWWSMRIDPQRLYQISGLPPRHIYGTNKLLWLREHHPSIFGAVRHWLSIEDFVLWKLTGELATDYSIASRTMLFDQRHLDWSEELLAVANLPRKILSKVYPSGTAIGRLSAPAASDTGLSAKTVAVTGGHDHLCGALAAGLLQTGAALDSTGTAAALLALADRYEPSERLRAAGLAYYRYVARDLYILQGGLSFAGGALAWLISLLSKSASSMYDLDYEALLASAASCPPGSRGLVWLPHFLGSGSPENDADSRAALLGLTNSHGPSEIVRALLEGLCYWLRQNVDLLEAELAVPLTEVIAIGGGAKPELWRALKADITGRPVRVPGVEEATAVGAALLAGLGVGIFTDEAAAVDSITTEASIRQPDLTHSAIYADLYRDLYLPLYALLRDFNHKLAGYQSPCGLGRDGRERRE